MLGQPIFPGDSGVDQLVEIIKILGTPNKSQILSMNPKYNQFDFPQIKPLPWKHVFRSRTPQEALDFIAELLVYEPNRRLSPIDALAHPYFDELKKEDATILGGEMSVPKGIFDIKPGKFIHEN